MPVKNQISWKIIILYFLTWKIFSLHHKVMKNESGRLIDVFLKGWHFTLINGVLSELLKTFKIKKPSFWLFPVELEISMSMFYEKVKPFLHYTDTSEIKISSQIVYCCVFGNCKVSCYGKTCHYFITKTVDYLGISDLSWQCFRSVAYLHLDI